MTRASNPCSVRQVDDDHLEIELADGVRYCAAACTHRGGRLLYARVDEARNRLVCPLHRSTFDLRDGSVLGGAADAPLWVSTERPEGQP